MQKISSVNQQQYEAVYCFFAKEIYNVEPIAYFRSKGLYTATTFLDSFVAVWYLLFCFKNFVNL